MNPAAIHIAEKVPQERYFESSFIVGERFLCPFPTIDGHMSAATVTAQATTIFISALCELALVRLSVFYISDIIGISSV
jgi:hypothetical protein